MSAVPWRWTYGKGIERRHKRWSRHGAFSRARKLTDDERAAIAGMAGASARHGRNSQQYLDAAAKYQALKALRALLSTTPDVPK